MLLNFFQKKYNSIIEAKVINDPVTKISKGYGFIRFSNQGQAQTCIADCQGNYILTKPVKLNNAAQRRNQPGAERQQPPQAQKSMMPGAPPFGQQSYF